MTMKRYAVCALVLAFVTTGCTAMSDNALAEARKAQFACAAQAAKDEPSKWDLFEYNCPVPPDCLDHPTTDRCRTFEKMALTNQFLIGTANNASATVPAVIISSPAFK